MKEIIEYRFDDQAFKLRNFEYYIFIDQELNHDLTEKYKSLLNLAGYVFNRGRLVTKLSDWFIKDFLFSIIISLVLYFSLKNIYVFSFISSLREIIFNLSPFDFELVRFLYNNFFMLICSIPLITSLISIFNFLFFSIFSFFFLKAKGFKYHSYKNLDKLYEIQIMYNPSI